VPISRRSSQKLVALLTLAALVVAGCASAPVRPQFRSTTLFDRIPGTASMINGRPVTIYLPPHAAGRSLPVVELLHAPASGSDSWLHFSGIKAIATIFAAHNGIAPIIVMPGMRRPTPPATGCVTLREQQHSQDLENYLADDVPNYVRSHYDTASGTQNWTVAGMTSQGTYAVALALRHPDVFGNFVDISGRTRPTDQQHRPSWLLQHGSYPSTAGWFESGRRAGGALRTQDRLAALSAAAGVSVHASTVTGVNGWTAWRTALRQMFPWILDRAQATTTSKPAGSSGAAASPSPSSRLSSGHVPALRRSSSVHRVPQCASGHRGRGADHRRSHPQRAHRSA
jgi:S-formylglutathione hydrolase FrmB